MNLQPLDIAVIKGHWYNPMDWIIFQHTSTLWGHCVVVRNEQGDCFDPRLKGIENNNLSKYAGREYKIRRFKGEINRPKMLLWCREKQKTAHIYDLPAVLGFLTGIKAFNDEDQWYCSELAYWVYQDNGYKLTDEEITFVYPCFFMQSNDFETIEQGG